MRIAICDDEKIWQEKNQRIIEDILEKLQMSGQVDTFGSGSQLLEVKEPYDLCFLDIEMEGESTGIELKQELARLWPQTRIIFTTTHQERMRESFGVNVIGFLEKPLAGEPVENLLMEYIKNLNKYYVNYTEEKPDLIDLDDISYIQADRKYTDIYLVSGKKLFSEFSISRWKELTDPAHCFMMPHRSYLVNIKQVRNVEHKVLMMNGVEIPYSRNHGQEIKEAFRQYMREEARRYVR